MNILENNKLIAEFMGYKFYNHLPVKRNGWQLPNQSDTAIYLAYSDEDLRYHSSWDWLMLVVEKIEREHKTNFITKCIWNEFNECSYYQVIVNIEKGEMSKDRSCIYNSKKVYDYIGQLIKDKRKATYEAVVEFIQWYNENKK